MTEILTRIQKLLARAASGNEHEAALALSMAQSLMDKHRVSMQDIEGLEGDDISQDAPLMLAGRISSWKLALINLLAEANGCVIVKQRGLGSLRGGQRGVSITLFGKPSDIEVVRLLVAHALKELQRFSPKSRGNPASRNSWYFGVVEGLTKKIQAKRRNIPASALVTLDHHAKVDAFIQRSVPGVFMGESEECPVNPRAFQAGFKRGSELQITAATQVLA